MKIKATRTIPTELIIKKEQVGNYPYVVTDLADRVVGHLRETMHGIYRVDMIDRTYQPEQTVFSAKDWSNDE